MAEGMGEGALPADRRSSTAEALRGRRQWVGSCEPRVLAFPKHTSTLRCSWPAPPSPRDINSIIDQTTDSAHGPAKHSNGAGANHSSHAPLLSRPSIAARTSSIKS